MGIMDNYKSYIKTGIGRWDYFTIGIYWLLVAPAIFYYNTSGGMQFTAAKYLPFLLLTILMDTFTVISLVFYVPQLWYAGNKWHSRSSLGAIALFVTTVGGFGFLYMLTYRQLYYNMTLITWGTWMGGIVQHVRSYGLLLVITYFRKSQADKHMLLETILDKEREEGKKLRNRISPHFLTNSLSGIQPSWVVGEGTPYVDKLMQMMEYFTYSCNKPNIPQEEEIQFIKTYLDMMASGLPHPENLHASFNIYEQGNQIVPGLLVQLLENAFKHGGKGPTNIFNLEVTVEDGVLYFLLSNAIVGNAKQEQEVMSGAGLEIFLRVLELHYRSNYRLNKFIEDDQYHVHLELTLKRFD